MIQKHPYQVQKETILLTALSEALIKFNNSYIELKEACLYNFDLRESYPFNDFIEKVKIPEWVNVSLVKIQTAINALHDNNSPELLRGISHYIFYEPTDNIVEAKTGLTSADLDDDGDAVVKVLIHKEYGCYILLHDSGKFSTVAIEESAYGTFIECERLLIDNFYGDKASTMKKYSYRIQSNTIWTSFDYGTVEAENIDAAKQKAFEQLTNDFEKANVALNHCDITKGFTLDFDMSSLTVVEEKVN